ncbi:hypothetical protein BC831DRAFT_124853 [Entophlyctis helioformis]|nr:hypothetical protein BC831DRAFT_124853 [Entophlyctis helioformis]
MLTKLRLRQQQQQLEAASSASLADLNAAPLSIRDRPPASKHVHADNVSTIASRLGKTGKSVSIIAPQDSSWTLLGSVEGTPRSSAYIASSAPTFVPSARAQSVTGLVSALRVSTVAPPAPAPAPTPAPVLASVQTAPAVGADTPSTKGVPPATAINLHAVEAGTRSLLTLQLDDLDGVLSRHAKPLSSRSVVVDPATHQNAASAVYSRVLSGVTAAYSAARRRDDTDVAEHLTATSIELAAFMAARGVWGTPTGPSAGDADLLLRVASMAHRSPLFVRAAAWLVDCVPRSEWDHDDAVHAMRLDSVFAGKGSAVRTAEARISGCVYEMLARSYVSPRKIEDEVRAMVKAVADTETAVDGGPLSAAERAWLVRWTRLRLRFEEVWRWYVRVVGVTDWSGPLEPDVQVVKTNALELMNAIVTLGRAYGEYEYVWYLFETATLLDFSVYVEVMAVCREARLGCDDKERSVWEARAWVVYRKSLDLVRANPKLYPSFMMELIGLVKTIDDVPKRFQHLVRLYKDMLGECRGNYFPISEAVLLPLIDQAWTHVSLHARIPEWRLLFRKIMRIYTLRKQYDERMANQGHRLLLLPFLSPASIVTLLKTCTVSGSLAEFKTLNRDVHERRFDGMDEYVAQVKKGFAAYLAEYIVSSEARSRSTLHMLGASTVAMIKDGGGVGGGGDVEEVPFGAVAAAVAVAAAANAHDSVGSENVGLGAPSGPDGPVSNGSSESVSGSGSDVADPISDPNTAVVASRRLNDRLRCHRGHAREDGQSQQPHADHPQEPVRLITSRSLGYHWTEDVVARATQAVEGVLLQVILP